MLRGLGQELVPSGARSPSWSCLLETAPVEFFALVRIASLTARLPERPKGMHRRTYEWLSSEAEKAELPYQDRLLKGLPGLLARLGVLPQTGSERPDEAQLAAGLQRALGSEAPLRQRKRARGRGRTKNSWPPTRRGRPSS